MTHSTRGGRPRRNYTRDDSPGVEVECMDCGKRFTVHHDPGRAVRCHACREQHKPTTTTVPAPSEHDACPFLNTMRLGGEVVRYRCDSRKPCVPRIGIRTFFCPILQIKEPEAIQ